MYKPTVILTGKNAGLWYIKTLNNLKKNNDGFEFDTLQVDFEPINDLLPHKMQEAARLLEPYFAELEQRKQPYILANITLHEAVQYFSFAPNFFISIQEILKKESRKDLGKVAILGTKFTMNHNYISSLLPNVALVSLPEKQQEQVENLRKVYYHTTDKALAKQVFGQLKELEIDCFVIACTELTVALGDSEYKLQTINLAMLQCDFF